MPRELTKKEIYERMKEWRNMKKLHKADRQRIASQEKIIKEQKERIDLLESVVEKLVLQVEELKQMVFSRKKKDKNDKNKPKSGNKAKKPRKPFSYRRPVPKEITRETNYNISLCPCCNTELKDIKTITRYIEDIILKSLKTVEKQNIQTGYCPNCKKRVSKKEIPKSLASLGKNTRLFVSYANVILRLSYRQIRHILKELYDIKISDGEIANILEKQSKKLEYRYHELSNNIRGGPAHYDETGYPVQSEEQGKYAWVMASSNSEDAVFRIGRSRGKGNAEILKGGSNNVGITDDYGAYKKLFKHHQLCWAHLLRKTRDLKNSKELDRKKRKHAKKTYDLLNSLFLKLKEELNDPYDKEQRMKIRQKMIRQAEKISKFSKYDCAKLRRIKASLLKNKEKYFTALLFKEPIPLTNNKAERALRHLVLKRKSSFGSRTQKGADVMSVLCSVLLSLWWSEPDDFFGEYRKLAYGE